MAMRIRADVCANCGMCTELCPVGAVLPPHRSEHQETYEINSAYCTECVGHFARPRCSVSCRLGCIVQDPLCIENRSALFLKWQSLTGGVRYEVDSTSGVESIEELGEPDA